MSSSYKQRLANFELMRIFAMYLILLWHIKGHFMADSDAFHPLVIKVTNLMSNCISFHVDLFILITGYFGIRSNKKAIVKNLLLCTIYLWGLNAFSYFLSGSFDIKEVIFPISHSPWWFMTAYFMLVLIAPFLERMFSIFSNNEWYGLIMMVLLLNVYFGHYQHLRIVYIMGYDLMNMLTVYCLGAFLRKPVLYEKIKFGGGKSKLLILLCFLTVLRMIISKVFNMLNLNISAEEYCAPLTIAMAINVFLLFKNITLKSSKWITFFSTSSVGVYLITDYPLVREYLTQLFPKLYSEFCFNGILGMLFILIFSIVLFVVCVFIDKFRLQIQSAIEHLINLSLNEYENRK